MKKKINDIQNENKQLKNENRTLSVIIKLIHENKYSVKCNKSSADDDTNQWEIVKSRRNKANKNISDPESVGFINKFQPLFIHKKEQSIKHNSSTSNDPIDFSITNSKRNEHNIKQKQDHLQL